MYKLVAYFAQRSLLSNIILFGVIFGALLAWKRIGKEEYPDFAFPWVRINIAYPGATAEDVELFVTKEIEENIKSINGIDEITTTSSYGRSSFSISIDSKARDADEVVSEVKDAVDRTSLPKETEDPVYRRFSSYEKAILDVGLYHAKKKTLDENSRRELQELALAFENQLRALPEISGFDKQGYLKPELQILVNPRKLRQYDLSLSEVRAQIIAQNVRVPVGSMEDKNESEISFLSELDNVEELKNLAIRGGFEGQRITLGQIAKIKTSFAKSKSIMKVQGHEMIFYNVKKSPSTDIISAQKAILKFVDKFLASHAESNLRIVYADDESYDVRNRLSIIAVNGIAGFLLILIVLFIFLDIKSGIWVAAGIPFCLGFTLIVTFVLGYSVNNITLAGIIIVLGIVVDDAIIVAENISRMARSGVEQLKAAVEGTLAMMNPIVASILTTCAAFLPMLFFEGRMGIFISFIPVIVMLMLAASLFESLFILPAHLYHPLPLTGFFAKILRRSKSNQINKPKKHWFFYVEEKYEILTSFLLRLRPLIIIMFVAFMYGGYWVFKNQFNFVMFPREETKEISVRAIGPKNINRYQMADLTRQIEDIFLKDESNVVLSVITRIGQSRRGGEVKENEASLRVEILPKAERDTPLKVLLAGWEAKAKELTSFQKIRFLKSRWGSSSGSPIHIEVQENDDQKREQVLNQLKKEMEATGLLANVEIDKPITKQEYQLKLIRNEVTRLGVNPSSIAQSLRAFIEGDILYKLNKGDEEVDVRLTSDTAVKDNINDILNLRAANSQKYLVPYRNLVKVTKTEKPANIQRINYKRASSIFADIKDEKKTTPLNIAEVIEKNIFPKISSQYPSAIMQFRGEVERSRGSESDFGVALLLSCVLIYMLLTVLFGSIALPLVIVAVVPFGIVGVLLAFWGHGLSQFGFMSVVGVLGMIGVVVNDSIVMVSKLEKEIQGPLNTKVLLKKVSQVASTRLRAVVVTTLTTVAGLFPTAYGWGGFDSMLSEMMLAMGWGLIFATVSTLVLVPTIYSYYYNIRSFFNRNAEVS